MTREEVLEIIKLAKNKKVRPNLYEVDLNKIDLSGTDLFGANLSEANLCGADLTNAKYTDATQWPDNFDLSQRIEKSKKRPID